MVSNSNPIMSVHCHHMGTDDAVKALHLAYFERTKLSWHSHMWQNVPRYYSASNRIADWSKAGAICGWLWGMIFGIGFFITPDITPVMEGGPIVSWFICSLGAAVFLGGLSALSAVVVSIYSTPISSKLKYRTAQQLRIARRNLVAQPA